MFGLEGLNQLSSAAPSQQCFGPICFVPVVPVPVVPFWMYDMGRQQEQLAGHVSLLDGPVFLSPFGTKGDVLPTLFAALGFVVANPGKHALFLTNPRHMESVRAKMAATELRWMHTTRHVVTGLCNWHTFVPAELKIETNTVTRFSLPFRMERWTYETSEGGQLTFLWATDVSTGSGDKWNWDHYQTPFNVDAEGWDTLGTYGEFLSHWQAVCGFVQVSMQGRAKFVTSQYARLSMAAQIDEALGITSSLLLRFSGMSLADPYQEAEAHNRHYALSATLAPNKLDLRSQLLCPHPNMKAQCHGVISKSEHIFEDVPLDLDKFLDTKPTVVVTISSFGQVDKVAKLFPTSDQFQVLFLGSACKTDADRSHMHYEGLVNLDAVFAKASLIVHGCGVGTVNQVALSGKPSIGVSSICEQHCNGSALEGLGVSRHFTLKSLCSTDARAADDFVTTIFSFFQCPASLATPERLEEVQSAVKAESELALAALLRRIDEVCSR